MGTPDPTTLRMIDGRQDKVKAHVVRSRAFRLTVEEPIAALDVVTCMHSCLFISI